MAPRKTTPISKHVWKPYHLLNRSAMLHGSTGSGKSRCSLFLCDLVKDFIDTVVVFCPSNDFHRDWTGVVPAIFIHKTLTTTALERAIEGQERKKQAIDYATEYGKKYWAMIPGSQDIDRRYEAKIREIDANTEKNKQLMTGDDYSRIKHEKYVAEYERNIASRQLVTKYCPMLFKKYGATQGDKKDQTSIKLTIFEMYFRLNYNMLMIIDDCTEIFCDIDDSVWKKLYTKLRHFNITLIMTTHSLNEIKGQVMRTSPFWHIFTTVGSAAYFLNNGTTGVKGIITPTMADLEAAYVIPDEQQQSHMRRVAISRDLGKIVSFTFPLEINFKVGSKTLWKASKILEEKKGDRPQALNSKMF